MVAAAGMWGREFGALAGVEARSVPSGTVSSMSSSGGPSYRFPDENNPPAAASHVPDTSSQQDFISAIAPGAMAAQSRYGVPAAVTIA